MQEIHEEMYKNISVLTKVYPPSNGFKEVFSESMYLRQSNYAAFYEVVYYLLTILAGETGIGIHIKNWPICNNSMANGFKREVVAFVNSLGNVHEGVHVPSIKLFTIMSPHGMKFVSFMQSLSETALAVTACKMSTNKHIVVNIKPCSRTFKAMALKEEETVKKLLDEYMQLKVNHKKEMEERKLCMRDKEVEYNRLLKDLEQLKAEVNLDETLDISVELETAKQQMKKIEEMSSKLQTAFELFTKLRDKKNVVENVDNSCKSLTELYSKLLGSFDKTAINHSEFEHEKTVSSNLSTKFTELRGTLQEIAELEEKLKGCLL